MSTLITSDVYLEKMALIVFCLIEFVALNNSSVVNIGCRTIIEIQEI